MVEEHTIMNLYEYQQECVDLINNLDSKNNGLYTYLTITMKGYDII